MSEQKEATAEEPRNPFRDAAGRFNKGNPGGPGNPFARFSAQMRKAFAEEASADDLRAVARAMIDKAKEGDVAAAKVVLSYTLGKPLAGVDPDRLDEMECLQFCRENFSGDQAGNLMHGLNATMLCLFLRSILPITSQAHWQILADGLNAAVEQDKQAAREAQEEAAREASAAAAEAEAKREPVEPRGKPAEPAGPDPSAREAARKAREILGERQILPIRPIADNKPTSGNDRAANPKAPDSDGGNDPGKGGPPAPA